MLYLHIHTSTCASIEAKVTLAFLYSSYSSLVTNPLEKLPILVV